MTERTRAAMMSAILRIGIVDESRIRVANRAFTVPTSGCFIEVSFLPVSSGAVTVGPNGSDRDIDIMQVTAVEPQGTGETFSQSVVSRLREFFKPGVSLPFESESATVEKAVRAPSFPSDAWWKTPVSIYFISHVSRA